MTDSYDELYAQAQAEVQQWLDLLAEDRRLNDTDREMICDHAIRLREIDPTLEVGDAIMDGFNSYRAAVEERWSVDEVDKSAQHITPSGPHTWRDDLRARDLQGVDHDADRAAWGASDSMRGAADLAAHRFQTARRLSEGEAPHVDAEMARDAAYGALWANDE
jgi:hypothetical protein